MTDPRRDMRDNAGVNHPRAQFAEQDIRDIRRLAVMGTPVRVIAEALGAARPTVYDIVRRRTWRSVPD